MLTGKCCCGPVCQSGHKQPLSDVRHIHRNVRRSGVAYRNVQERYTAQFPPRGRRRQYSWQFSQLRLHELLVAIYTSTEYLRASVPFYNTLMWPYIWQVSSLHGSYKLVLALMNDRCSDHMCWHDFRFENCWKVIDLAGTRQAKHQLINLL